MLDQRGGDFKANNQYLHEAMKLREAMEKLVEASEIIKSLYNNGHFVLSEDYKNYRDFLEKSLQMVNYLEKSAENKLIVHFGRCIKKDK